MPALPPGHPSNNKRESLLIGKAGSKAASADKLSGAEPGRDILSCR